MKLSLIAFAALWACVVGARAQSAGPGDARFELPRDGWQLLELSAYTGFTNIAPSSGGANFAGTVPVGSDSANGGALRGGWSRHRERSSVMVSYEALYYGFVRHSEWSSLNHSATLHATKALSSKWDTALSATASVRSLNAYLFAPSSLSGVVAAPGSFEDLANAVLAGSGNNPELSSLTLLQEPLLSTALYSQRLLHAAASESLIYRHSPRLTLRIDASGARIEPISSGQPWGASRSALLRNTSTGTVRTTVSYSTSPETQIGLEVSESRTVSNIMDSYVTRALVSVGRKIEGRWVVQGAGGIATANPTRQGQGVPTRSQFAAHGSAGYKGAAHSFMAKVDRTPSDIYGIQGGYTLSTAGAWQWRRPGGKWEVSSNIRQQHFGGPSVRRLDGWMAGIVVMRALTRRTGCQFAYSFLDNSGTYAGLRNMKVQALRAGIVWRNEGVR